MSSISESSFQDFGQPIAVGMVSTEGEKLLNALRKIQCKLKDKHQRHDKSGEKALIYGHEVNKTKVDEQDNYTLRGSGDHFRADLKSGHKCPEPVMCIHRPSDDINSQLIDTRLKLIETQLQNISMQLMANNCHKNETTVQKETKKVSISNGRHKESANKSRISSIDDHIVSDDKYQSSINAIKQMVRSSGDRINQRIAKSVSMDGINGWNTRNNGSKHFHLQTNLQNIPFIPTNTSKSHSVIANRQLEMSRLKQHNPLCSEWAHNRKLFDQTLRTKELDHQIKELLYDLQEEHNYICEEIQYLSKQLEKIKDPNKRIDFNRELYFLSRRILAKKRQINELQELHEIVRKNSLRDRSDQSLETKPKPIKRLCQTNQML